MNEIRQHKLGRERERVQGARAAIVYYGRIPCSNLECGREGLAQDWEGNWFCAEHHQCQRAKARIAARAWLSEQDAAFDAAEYVDAELRNVLSCVPADHLPAAVNWWMGII